jgi:signal transduction histidine kinase
MACRFNEFNPDSIKETKFDPPLVITGFRIANKEVPVAINAEDISPLKKNITETSDITLPYNTSVFSFEFASLNYIHSEKKQYAYMLEGFDMNWNEVGPQRIATYTNLDPGKYVFKVKGLNNGEWSSRTIRIPLIITPPFWLTWWFKLVVLIVIISGTIGFYKFRINIIEAQKRKLEQRVQEQTQQLILSAEEEHRAREEAEQANKDLGRKNKEMEQFAYIVSHDLQEPLRTTSSFVGLLQKQHHQGKLDEKADKYFTFILEASDRMKMLIKNLLDFSRIGVKKELEHVDCDKILYNVLADLGMAISEAGANIKHDPLPVINGYGTELKQLFQNLITNAIKFRKKETSPEINISVQRKDGYWEFAFKDNGIGIQEKHNEKIFVIFQRLHTRTEYEGSGIGLSHCKKIVELHKGEIWVESKPGEGSIFYFTIQANNFLN